MKKLLSGVCLVVSIALLVSSFLALASVAVDTGYTYEGEADKLEWFTWYTYKTYRDPVYAIAMYNSLKICSPVYHIQGHSSLTLNYQQSVSLSATRTDSFGSSLGLSVGIKIVEIACETSRAVEYATAIEIQATGGVACSYSSSVPTGYYTMIPCRNFRRYEVDKMKRGTVNITESKYFYSPEGSTYLTTVYSPDNINWSIYG